MFKDAGVVGFPLRAGHKMLAVKHHGGHTCHTTRGPELLFCAHLLCAVTTVEHGGCCSPIKPDAVCDISQYLRIVEIFSVGEIGVEQGQFGLLATSLIFGPVNQLMGAECVHDPHVIAKAEREAQLCAKGGQPVAGLLGFRGCATIFSGDMFAQVFAFIFHLRVQLKGVPVDVERNTGVFCGFGQLAIAHDTPRADDVGDDINTNGFRGVGH